MEVVKEYINAINECKLDLIAEHISKEHVFIDSQDNVLNGKVSMIKAWKGYFALFPNYKIHANEMFKRGNFIYVFGYASGTYKGEESDKDSNWKIPSAWKILIHDKKIKQWQVYADNSKVLEILNKNL